MSSRTLRTLLAAVALCCVSGLAVAQSPRPTPKGSCPTGDCIAHSIQSQARCTEESHGPVGNSVGWLNGLSTNADQRILGGRIAAYQIKWSSGWSSWYVPGQNDIDTKFNPGTNEMRRVWAYFSDHEHRYVICR